MSARTVGAGDTPKHTPGPWLCRGGFDTFEEVRTAAGRPVAILENDIQAGARAFAQREANGRLIEAAPDLLHVASELLRLATPTSAIPESLVKLAIEAMAKAGCGS